MPSTLPAIYILHRGDREFRVEEKAQLIAIKNADGLPDFLTLGTMGEILTGDAGRGAEPLRNSVTSADASAGFNTDAIPSPGAGLKAVITDLIISSDTEMRLDFAVESATGTIIETVWVAAKQTIQFTPRGKWKLATAAKKLLFKSSAAGNVRVTTFYYLEA